MRLVPFLALVGLGACGGSGTDPAVQDASALDATDSDATGDTSDATDPKDARTDAPGTRQS